MAMPTLPKTVFDRSLKLARAPLNAALSVAGSADSPAKRLLDQIEASTRSATGILFQDDELRREGRAVRLASNQRQGAAEAERRQQEARRRAEADRRAAEKHKRERKVKAAATVRKVEAKDESLDAEEKALAGEREADQIVDAAVAAKEARKNGYGAGR